MRLWLALAVLAALAGCASAPRLPIMNELEQARRAPAVSEARLKAPQAYARAELLRQRAEEAHRTGDLAGAQILSERALAAYLRATIEARLAVSEARLAEAKLARQQAEMRLAQLDAEQQRLAAEVADLELRAKVARDVEPIVPSKPASPERDKARREAARAILSQASLLCVSAGLVEPARAALPALKAKGAELGQRIDAGPAPIDDAMSLRSECLRELTLARRPRVQQNPSRGESDALLSALSRADFLPFRDDRGVVVTLRGLRTAGKLTPAATEKLQALGAVAKAHPAFPVLLVLHDARPGAKDDGFGAELAAALESAGAARVQLERAGSAEPVVPPQRPGAAGRNERVEVVFVSPGT
jgi:hypothetical protein